MTSSLVGSEMCIRDRCGGDRYEAFAPSDDHNEDQRVHEGLLDELHDVLAPLSWDAKPPQPSPRGGERRIHEGAPDAHRERPLEPRWL
eukprot:4941683-Prorocentrum_lima.AAC.1